MYYFVKVRHTKTNGNISEWIEKGTGKYAVPKLYQKGPATSLARQRMKRQYGDGTKVMAWIVPVVIHEREGIIV